MSCFSGSFAALPGVRCDRFQRLSGGGGMTVADQFFLSHCHTDHMVGLDELGRFLRRKAMGSRLNHKLYCSSISKAFIKDRFKIPEKAFVELMPNEPKTVHVYDSNDFYWLRITAIGANHCPGSIMFLFEKLDIDGETIVKRILYTGDFRFEFDIPLIGLQPLHNGTGEPLDIDEMFLDTTFCSEQYESFPTRREAEEKIWDQCDKWIKRNGIYKNTRNKHVILLTLPARYGYERILKYVYEKSLCKRRVHVNKDKFTEYLCLRELSDSTEPDPKLAPWIHACTAYKKDRKKQNEPLRKTLPCQSGEFEVCQIKPSATFFTKAQMDRLSKAGLDRVMSVSQGGNYYRICYSCHSSLTELKRFVQYFKPKKICPCVIPRNSSRMEVIRILDMFLDEVRPEDIPSPDPSPRSSLSSLQNFSLVSSQIKTPEDDSLAWLKVTTTPSPQKNNTQALRDNPSVESQSRVCFDEFMEVDESVNDSSDDDGEKENTVEPVSKIQIIPGIIPEELPGPSKEPELSCTITSEPLSRFLRRRTFAQSRAEQTYYSMPIQQESEVSVPKERRFSMPSNMKLPLIKVTPSSPSPDPDDPDYPEFFQDRLYLEHVSKKFEDDQCPAPDPQEQGVEDQSVDILATEAAPPEEEMPKPPSLPMFKGSVRRIKRQQSMFRPDYDEEIPSKLPKVVLLECENSKYFEKDIEHSKSTHRSVLFKESVSRVESDHEQKVQPESASTIQAVKRKSLFAAAATETPKEKMRILAPDSDEELDQQESSAVSKAGNLDSSKFLVIQGQVVETVDSGKMVETEEIFESGKSIELIEEVSVAKEYKVEETKSEPHQITDNASNFEKPEKVMLTPPNARDLHLKSSPSSTQSSMNNSCETIVISSSELEAEEAFTLQQSGPRSPTPEIDQLIDSAEKEGCPEYIMQNLRKVAKIRKNVVQID